MNAPGKNAVAVAELAMGLILALDRRIPDSVAELRAGALHLVRQQLEKPSAERRRLLRLRLLLRGDQRLQVADGGGAGEGIEVDQPLLAVALDDLEVVLAVIGAVEERGAATERHQGGGIRQRHAIAQRLEVHPQRQVQVDARIEIDVGVAAERQLREPGAQAQGIGELQLEGVVIRLVDPELERQVAGGGVVTGRQVAHASKHVKLVEAIEEGLKRVKLEVGIGQRRDEPELAHARVIAREADLDLLRAVPGDLDPAPVEREGRGDASERRRGKSGLRRAGRWREPGGGDLAEAQQRETAVRDPSRAVRVKR